MLHMTAWRHGLLVSVVTSVALSLAPPPLPRNQVLGSMNQASKQLTDLTSYTIYTIGGTVTTAPSPPTWLRPATSDTSPQFTLNVYSRTSSQLRVCVLINTF